MRYLALIPIAIALYLFVRSVAAKAARSPDWQKNRVYLPDLLFWVGLLGNLFVIPSVILLWQENLLGLAFVAFSLMGWSAQLAYSNCWVRFGDRGFTHHTFFGRTHEFTYQDVTGIRWGSDIRLYCGKHLIFLDSMAVNASRFLKWVRKRNKQIQTLPDRIQWDPFDDNVPNGKLIFFLMTGLMIFWVFLMGSMVYALFGPPRPLEAYERREVIFTDWRETGSGDIYLTGTDGTEYGIESWVQLPVEPEAFCGTKTACTAWVRGKDRLWIYQLDTQKESVFTLAQYEQNYRDSQRWAFWLMLAFTVFAIWTYVRMLQVGRHPERYSPRARKWFFRDL